MKLITEIIPKKTQVLVTHSRAPLAIEIIRQLSDNPHIEVVACEDPTPQLIPPDSLGVVIHLPGFGPDSLAETLSHTSVLHHLLNLSLSHQATFILAIPNTRSHLYHTAVTMVTQFGKNFPLTYQILEIDKNTPLPSSAADVIKKFVYGHRARPTNPPSGHLPSPSSRPAPLTRPTVPHLRSYLKKIVLSLLLAFASIWAMVAVFSALTLAAFTCSHTLLLQSRFPFAVKCAQTALFSSQLVQAISPAAIGSRSALSYLGFPISESQAFLDSHHRSLVSLAQLASQSRAIFAGLFTTTAPSPPQFSFLLPSISQATESLAELMTDLRSFHSTSSRPSARIAKLADEVQFLHGSLAKSQLLLPSLDQLFSSPKSVVAAVVQDNLELKPTGGLIDTIVVFTLDSGRVTSVQIVSASTADQKLKGQAEAPADFRAATNQSTWLLKDSNWDPDFPTTPQPIAWFIEKELAVTPDLLISTNHTLVADLLDILGSVSLDSPSVTFTGTRFSSQYLDFLKSYPDNPSPLPEIIRVLLSRLSQSSPQQIDRLNTSLLASLESGQTQIASLTFPSPFVTAGWGGGVAPPVCSPGQSCFSDYAYPVIANLGSNKADAYLDTTFHLDVAIQPSRITKDITYQLRHTESSSTWPSGSHQAYLRIYLPASAQLDSLSLNGEPLSRDNYTISSDHGLLLIGLPVTTPPASLSQIKLSTWQPFSPRGKLRYQLDLPTQAGSPPARSASVAFSYPESWFVSSYQTPVVASPGRLEYNAPSRGPFQITIDLTPTQ